MNALEAKRELRALLDKHELYHVEAKLNGRMTSTFGRYRYSRYGGYEYVELSTKLVNINDAERVRLTIIHEVAHVLTKGHGHDKVWKAKCLELGGDGRATYTRQNTNTIERKPRKRYQAYCSEHGGRGIYYQRRSRACGSCCNAYNGGRYSKQYELEYREV